MRKKKSIIIPERYLTFLCISYHAQQILTLLTRQLFSQFCSIYVYNLFHNRIISCYLYKHLWFNLSIFFAKYIHVTKWLVIVLSTDQNTQQNFHPVMWVGKGLTCIFRTSYCNIMIKKQYIGSGPTREKMVEIHDMGIVM